MCLAKRLKAKPQDLSFVDSDVEWAVELDDYLDMHVSLMFKRPHEPPQPTESEDEYDEEKSKRTRVSRLEYAARNPYSSAKVDTDYLRALLDRYLATSHLVRAHKKALTEKKKQP